MFNSEAKGMLLDIIERQRNIIKINFLEIELGRVKNPSFPYLE